MLEEAAGIVAKIRAELDKQVPREGGMEGGREGGRQGLICIAHAREGRGHRGQDKGRA